MNGEPLAKPPVLKRRLSVAGCLLMGRGIASEHVEGRSRTTNNYQLINQNEKPKGFVVQLAPHRPLLGDPGRVRAGTNDQCDDTKDQ